MTRLLVLPLLIGFACVLAGSYGMVHNQISYTVGPEYFTRFKFLQFQISPDIPDRVGAALVGWQASWWMGLIIGAPIALATSFMPDVRGMVLCFLRVSVLIVAIALGLGCASLLIPVTPEMTTLVYIPGIVQDPVAFARAALMHDASYLAGGIGLLVGLIRVRRLVRRARAGATRAP